jgi:nitroimidazol reductase NimA-like FMN-containing flavoprotein (pyridoxamine 5'-phosphate oxidase superfamily)
MTTAGPSTLDTRLEELSDGECRLLLGLVAVGRIAFVVDGLPVVLPVNYRVLSDESGLWVLLRTRPGNAIDGAPENVAFEIDGIDFNNHTGWSVLVRGALHHLDHNEIELFSKRFDPNPWLQEERTSWLAIKPRTVTGRRLQAADSEWAFPSEAYL